MKLKFYPNFNNVPLSLLTIQVFNKHIEFHFIHPSAWQWSQWFVVNLGTSFVLRTPIMGFRFDVVYPDTEDMR